MHTQNVNQFAPSAIPVFYGHSPCLQGHDTWHWVPLTWLKNFDVVSNQFVDFGVSFEDAIAICPSNPRFALPAGDRVVLPRCHQRPLKIRCDRRVMRVELGLVSSQAVTVSVLDRQGHCVAIARTPAPTHQPHSIYPQQGVTIDTQGADLIRIDAKAPFVLAQLAVNLVNAP